MNRSHYVLLLRRLVLLLVLYGGCRAFFLAFNYPLYADLGAPILARLFAQGTVFDLATVLLINAPIMAFSLLPSGLANGRHYQGRLSTWFQGWNLPFLLLNVAGIGYFAARGEPLNLWVMPLTLSGEQMRAVLAGYWPVALAAGVVATLLVWFDPSSTHLRRPRTVETPVGLLFIGALLLAAPLVFASVARRFPPPARDRADALARPASFCTLAHAYQRWEQWVDN